MKPIDSYLLVRAASVYLTVTTMLVILAWRRPGSRTIAGALLACCWNLPVILALNVIAPYMAWWRFDAEGGLLLGVPVDLYLAWICLWGAIPAIAFPSLPIWLVVAIALVVDLVLMPAASPVVQLGPWWLFGECAALVYALVPAQLLARWTRADEHLEWRASLQIIAFSGLLLFVLPAMILENSPGGWVNPLTRPVWQVSVLLQLLAIPAAIGLTAVQEFVTRGGGTPVPFDPPRRFVTSGVYAYVANPMQLAAVVMLLMMGLIVRNAWLAAAGVMAHQYSQGLAGWDEGDDLRKRFGDAWIEYRRGVRRWVPRFRPWHPVDRPPARLYVSATCSMCREVAAWFERRGTRGLVIVPAEHHPSQELRRITYEPADGSRSVSGVEAIARALEHIHLGWAFVGFLLRLPIVCQFSQLLADASGAERRTIPQVLHR
jgi:protein-S-isoprenylcysteine O-methyltransferase Ste14